MKILLTGATGLIGTEVMKTLAAAGHQVTATDRKGGEIPPGVEFILGELTDDNFVNSRDFNVDAIVHLGSIPLDVMHGWTKCVGSDFFTCVDGFQPSPSLLFQEITVLASHYSQAESTRSKTPLVFPLDLLYQLNISISQKRNRQVVLPTKILS